MIPFVIYDLGTGQIKRSVVCTQEQAAASCASDEFFLPSSVSDDTHYVSVSSGIQVPIPPRPGASHNWDWSSKAWVFDLGAAKQATRLQAEKAYRAKLLEPILYDGRLYKADTDKRAALTTHMLALEARANPAPASLRWRDSDGVLKAFTSPVEHKLWIKSLVIALDDRDFVLEDWYWDKLAAIDSAATAQELAAIDLK